MNYEEICYKKNFLKAVIIRIDFVNQLTEIREQLPNDIINEIKKSFEIVEPVMRVEHFIPIKKDEEKDKREEIQYTYWQWNFHNKNRSKHIAVDKYNINMSFDNYESYEDFIKYFLDIFLVFNEKFSDIQVKRLGLRYINEIILKGNPFTWKIYLNPKLISIIDFPEDKNKISRAFHTLDLNYDNFKLKFQYGMHNPDFPTPIKCKHFVLDYDASSERVLNKNEIIELLPQLHNSIQDSFEKSIKVKLRSKLNE